MATYTMDKFTYGGNTYVLQDSGALQLTGGSVTGPVNFGDSVSIDDLTAGQLIVTGNASFTNHINANTITATTPAVGDSSTNVATTAFVTNALSDLTGPMMFIGTVGTGGTATALPTAAAANKGHTYKVISALTTPIVAKVGDTVVSTGSTWVVIPSGDEPSGTVTNIATGTGLTGGPITNTGTISLATITKSNSTSTASPSHGGTFTAIDSITYDNYGRVTGVNTKTVTLPADSNTHNTAYLYAGASSGSVNAATTNGNTYLILMDGGSATTRRKISGSTNVSVTSDANGNITITGPDLSGYALSSAIPTETTVSGWGFTKNTGTLTGVTFAGTSMSVSNGVASITQANARTALGLATVATSGSYNDLTNKPTIPTDTNYYHTTGSWSGLTYTATANGGAGALAFTIPTGTSASTVAAGNHTHSEYVPLTSDSVTIKSNQLRIQNKSGNTSQAGSYPYVTSIHIGDNREVTIDEYGDGYMALHGNSGIFLHTGTPITVYDPSQTYTVGTIVWYNRAYYRCNTAITTAEEWTSSHWDNISTSGQSIKVIGQFYPAVTETYSLGSSSLKWKDVYTKTLNGVDVPTSPVFTDENVKQTNTTTNSAYEILFSYTADNTQRTEGARKTSTLTYNPSTKALVTGGTVDGYTLAAASAKAVTDSTSASAISTGTSVPTERDIYYGLPTINNSHAYTSSTTIYAPTAGGTSGYYLQGAGTTTAPTWQSPSDSSSASAISSTSTTLTTERDIYYGLPTINGAHNYTSSTNIYAPTTAGTSGYYLKSTGSGAPTWDTIPAEVTVTLNGSSTTTPSFYAPTTAGTAGQALISNGSGAPTWGTAGASIQIVRW